MFFNGSNSNGTKAISVNTRVFTSYSDTSALTLSAWNQNLSIRVQPCVGKDSNGLRQYAQEQEKIMNTSMTPDNAIALLTGIKEKILPAVNSGEKAKVSISMGGTQNTARKIISVEYDGTDAYLEFCTNVDEHGVTDEAHTIKHKFNKRSWYEGYDYKNGAGEEITCETDLLGFISRLENMKDLVPMVAHSIKYDNATRTNYAQNNGGQSTYQKPAAPQYSAPTTNYNQNDMGDFLPFN